MSPFRFGPVGLLRLTLIAFCMSCASLGASEKGSHLFILSGQSNMAGLRPGESFTPAVVKAFGSKEVTVVKDAQGGQPIRRWYKEWKPAQGTPPESTGDLYDRLMKKVRRASQGKVFQSVTFIWMQGERDAREKHGTVYAASLLGLIGQLEKDLGRQDMNVVIGRLSDFDLTNKRYPHWTLVREAQQAVVDRHPRAALVLTDDLNDGTNRKGKTIKNDLHLSSTGYKMLGTRFAERAIHLIRKTAP